MAGEKEMKPIRVKDYKEFASKLEALIVDYVYTESIFRQRVSLYHYLTKHADEFNTAKTFWNLTFRAHDDAILIRLCRLYDQHPAALSLRRILLTIKDNPDFFDKTKFQERFKDEPYVETATRSVGQPDADQLAKDIEFASANNPLVAKLDKSRGRVVAHRDPRSVPGKVPLPDTDPLTQQEVAELLNNARTILNRYRELFKGVEMWGVISGIGDYEDLLKGVRSTAV
ncbi:MAG: hypothetical protein ABSA12_03285 [Verrucomicrobiia bacterium]